MEISFDKVGFWYQPGTPFAFHNPIPTFPFSSPTAANTEKDILLPPLTVLETLLILKRLSLYSLAFASLSLLSLAKINPPSL